MANDPIEPQAKALADEALSNFNLSEYLEGEASVPTDTVTVVLKADAVFKRAQLIEKRDRDFAVEGKGITGEHELDGEIERLTEEISGSVATFDMRAMYAAERRAISDRVKRDHPVAKNATEEERAQVEVTRRDATIEKWIQKSVTKVVLPNGKVLTGSMSDEGIASLRATLHDTQWEKLEAKFGELSLAGDIFDSEVDAGFPG